MVPKARGRVWPAGWGWVKQEEAGWDAGGRGQQGSEVTRG